MGSWVNPVGPYCAADFARPLQVVLPERLRSNARSAVHRLLAPKRDQLSCASQVSAPHGDTVSTGGYATNGAR